MSNHLSNNVMFNPKKMIQMREQAHLTRTQAANLAGVSVKRLALWENTNPNTHRYPRDIDALNRLAIVYHCSLQDFSDYEFYVPERIIKETERIAVNDIESFINSIPEQQREEYNMLIQDILRKQKKFSCVSKS